MTSKPVSHFAAGAVLAIIGIILFFTYYYLGLSYASNFLSYVPAITTFLLVAFFVIAYGKALNHHVTFGNLFGYGFRITSIYVLIMVAFMVAINYLLPAYKENFLVHFSQQMDKAGDLTDEQKEMAISKTSEYFIVLMAGGALFIDLISGTLGSLVGAAFARKEPASPFDSNQ